MKKWKYGTYLILLVLLPHLNPSCSHPPHIIGCLIAVVIAVVVVAITIAAAVVAAIISALVVVLINE
jgi:hypothetical protein